jgi:hypothetical protein
MLFEVVLVSFSSVFRSASLMRNEITFCNCSALILLFLNDFGSLETVFLMCDMSSSCIGRKRLRRGKAETEYPVQDLNG